MLKISFWGSWKETHGCEARSVQPWWRGNEAPRASGRLRRELSLLLAYSDQTSGHCGLDEVFPISHFELRTIFRVFRKAGRDKQSHEATGT